MISFDTLSGLIFYNPITGNIHWRINRRGGVKAGDIAGCLDNHGYRVIRVNRRVYKAHRLAWFLMTHEWPKDQIDHINGDRSDNRWTNIREATSGQNMQNRRTTRTNKSGRLGVSWDAKAGKWQANVRFQHKKYYLGMFEDPDEAHRAYLLKKSELHKFNPEADSPTSTNP